MKKREKKAGKKPARNKNVQSNEMFNFDNEIVIGVTKIPEKKKKKVKKRIKKKVTEKENKKPDKIEAKKGQAREKINRHIPNKKIDLKKEKRKRRIISFMKGIVIITVVLGAILGISLSPLFKIENIEVEGNNKVAKEEIVKLSQISKGKNIFLVNNNNIINQIKQNAYIENVKIHRKLPNVILLEVEERQATYSLQVGEKYAYINNQGYILEISQSNNNLTQIISYKTKAEDIKPGGRLGKDDLEMLGTILKIMEVANNNGIGNLITGINIENKSNIILRLESER